MERKSSKALLLLLWGLAVQWLVNHYIFKRAVTQDSRAIDEPESFYKWRHGKIHYTKKGRGKPLLLLHGISPGASGHEWYKNGNALSNSYTVYTLDLLGFGYSDKPKTTYTAYLYTRLINDFIEDVIKEPVYVAASNSAAAFCVMAYSFRPDWIKKMLLITPTGIHDTMPTTNSHYMKLLLESPGFGTSIYNFVTSRTSIAKYLKEQAFYDETKIEACQVKANHFFAHFGGKSARYALASYLSHYTSVDIKKNLRTAQIPVLIVDRGHLPELEGNMRIQTTAIENTKRLPHVENPRAFYRLCKGFFNDTF